MCSAHEFVAKGGKWEDNDSDSVRRKHLRVEKNHERFAFPSTQDAKDAFLSPTHEFQENSLLRAREFGRRGAAKTGAMTVDAMDEVRHPTPARRLFSSSGRGALGKNPGHNVGHRVENGLLDPVLQCLCYKRKNEGGDLLRRCGG